MSVALCLDVHASHTRRRASCFSVKGHHTLFARTSTIRRDSRLRIDDEREVAAHPHRLDISVLLFLYHTFFFFRSALFCLVFKFYGSPASCLGRTIPSLRRYTTVPRCFGNACNYYILVVINVTRLSFSLFLTLSKQPSSLSICIDRARLVKFPSLYHCHITSSLGTLVWNLWPTQHVCSMV